MKKQSKPVMNGTASPAEVFHRNLVDAVSNVEGMASADAQWRSQFL